MTPVYELGDLRQEGLHLTKDKLIANQVNVHKELRKR